MFVVGVTLYKPTLHVPCWRRFSRDAFGKAAVEQGVRKLRSLPPGYFDVLHYSTERHQVAVFRYSSMTGCCQTDSSQNSKLPMPIKRHSLREFKREPNKITVGLKYVFGYDHPYNVQGQAIVQLCDDRVITCIAYLLPNHYIT